MEGPPLGKEAEDARATPVEPLTSALLERDPSGDGEEGAWGKDTELRSSPPGRTRGGVAAGGMGPAD